MLIAVSLFELITLGKGRLVPSLQQLERFILKISVAFYNDVITTRFSSTGIHISKVSARSICTLFILRHNVVLFGFSSVLFIKSTTATVDGTFCLQNNCGSDGDGIVAKRQQYVSAIQRTCFHTAVRRRHRHGFSRRHPWQPSRHRLARRLRSLSKSQDGRKNFHRESGVL